jgi:DHA1 family bicyclomycin/chloramphenicol resistance-like MFS transporter
MAAAATAGALVGHFHNGTPMVMAATIVICALLGTGLYLLLIQRNPTEVFETREATSRS